VWEEQGSYIVAEKTRIITTKEQRGLLLLQGEQEGRSDPGPMTTLVLFGMNSNSFQLLDLLQALKLFHFFFPSLTSRLPIKKLYSIAQAFQTPTTYLCPTKNLKPRRHSKVEAVLLKMMLQRQC
jgi:hypothetical protein